MTCISGITGRYAPQTQTRAGCAMCKPQKNPDTKLGHTGFGKLRALFAAQQKERDE